MPESTLVFDPFSQEFFDDPYKFYRCMRTEAPVYHCDQYDFYALTRDEDVAAQFAVEVITAMLGIPEDYVQQVRLWTDTSLHREPGQIEMAERGRQAITESTAYFYDVVQQRRAQSGESDLFSLLMAAEIEREDGGITGLSDFEIMGFASQLGGAGAETVTKLLASAGYLFARHPDQWAKPPDDRSLISAAVEELLRYDNPVHYDVRRSVKDSTLHGVTIPIGKPVFPMLASANRDREAWTDADVRHRAEPHRGPESGAGLRHPQLPGRRARTDGNRHRAGEVARLHASL